MRADRDAAYASVYASLLGVCLQAILGVCASSLARAARATIFVTSLSDAGEVLAAWQRSCAARPKEEPRAMTPLASVSLVEVASLPRGALVEFQVSALGKEACGAGEEAWQACFGRDGQRLEPGHGEGVGIVCACGSGGDAVEGRWCAATLGYSTADTQGAPLQGTAAWGEEEAATAGAALGRSLRWCLQEHRLSVNELISLRIVSHSNEQHLANHLRRALLHALHAQAPGVTDPPLPGLREPGGGQAVSVPADGDAWQVSVISAPRLAVAQGTGGNAVMFSARIVVEAVAAASTTSP